MEVFKKTATIFFVILILFLLADWGLAGKKHRIGIIVHETIYALQGDPDTGEITKPTEYVLLVWEPNTRTAYLAYTDHDTWFKLPPGFRLSLFVREGFFTGKVYSFHSAGDDNITLAKL